MRLRFVAMTKPGIGGARPEALRAMDPQEIADAYVRRTRPNAGYEESAPNPRCGRPQHHRHFLGLNSASCHFPYFRCPSHSTVRAQPAFVSAARTADVVHYPSPTEGWPVAMPTRTPPPGRASWPFRQQRCNDQLCLTGHKVGGNWSRLAQPGHNDILVRMVMTHSSFHGRDSAWSTSHAGSGAFRVRRRLRRDGRKCVRPLQ